MEKDKKGEQKPGAPELSPGLLLRGKTLVFRGRGRNKYTLREILPVGVRKSSFQHLTRNRTFRLRADSQEKEFQVGEVVTVRYPASRILWQGMPEAVWAFSGKEKNLSASVISCSKTGQ